MQGKKEESERKRTKERREADKEQWTRQKRIPNDWTTGMQAEVRPLENKVIEKKVKHAVKHWFGSDSSSEEEDDQDEEKEEMNWNIVERKKRRQEKSRKMKEKKKKRKEEVFRKAQHMVGLGPIDSDILEKHLEIERNNFEKAKEGTVKEHLKKYYKYNKRELEELEILETKYNPKGEGLIYIAVAEREQIRDIYKRKAECKRDETTLLNFIPPQIYKRFVALNKLCTARRMEDKSLKTQVRFGKSDLEVLTKIKGGEDPFKTVSLEQFLGEDTIPEFEEDVKWQAHKDRAPRRRVTSSRSSSPASRNSSPERPNDKNMGKQMRKMSINSDDELPHKKRKDDGSMDSCRSNDLIAAIRMDVEEVDPLDLNKTQ